MTPEEKTARRNLVRYGLFIIVVLAMTITSSALYLASAQIGEPLNVLPITFIMTVAVGVLAVGVYFVYNRYLDRV